MKKLLTTTIALLTFSSFAQEQKECGYVKYLSANNDFGLHIGLKGKGYYAIREPVFGGEKVKVKLAQDIVIAAYIKNAEVCLVSPLPWTSPSEIRGFTGAFIIDSSQVKKPK